MNALTWEGRRIGDALEGLAAGAGLTAPARAARAAQRSPDAPSEPAQLAAFVESVAEWLGFEAEPIAVAYADVEDVLRRAGPALVAIGPAASRVLAIAGGAGSDVRVLAPSGPARISREAARRLLCAAHDDDAGHAVDRVLDRARVPHWRRGRVRRALLAERLRDARVATAWLLRACPAAPLDRAARALGVWPRIALIVALYAAQYALGLGGMALIGRAALAGRFDRGWLLGALLLLLTLVPLRLASSWVSGELAIDAGAEIKRRLLAGVLALDPDEARRDGLGHFLGVTFESAAIEQLGVSGGFLALFAVIELVASLVVVALGAGGALHAAILLAWVGVAATFGARFHRRRAAWTEGRLRLSQALSERLVGHRTRILQEPRDEWHDDEDRGIARSLTDARQMDDAFVVLAGIVPRGWLAVGVASLLVIAASRGASTAPLAVGLGGVILAYRALRTLADGLARLSGARIAWTGLRALLVPADAEPPGSLACAVIPRAEHRAPVLEAQDLTFRYPHRTRTVLDGASLVLSAGDRVLLDGASGSGKSTLASLLVGLRRPTSGLLLLRGLDRATFGAAGWRRRVVSAPQFHENHVLSAPFAFNLLLGRRWPPEPDDLRDAEEICRELELGPLLDRMPAGLMQMVGETGWQLSHGEKSRLYIARALLQRADVLVLDESFGALDPKTLEIAMHSVLRRAKTLVVIAHP